MRCTARSRRIPRPSSVPKRRSRKALLHRGRERLGVRIPNTAGTSSSDEPDYLTVYGNKLFFRANRAGGANKLFCYDDMTAELTQVSNTIGNQAQADDQRYLMVYGNKLFLSAWSAFAVSKLFVYEDGAGSIVQLSNTHADPLLSDSPVPQILGASRAPLLSPSLPPGVAV